MWCPLSLRLLSRPASGSRFVLHTSGSSLLWNTLLLLVPSDRGKASEGRRRQPSPASSPRHPNSHRQDGDEEEDADEDMDDDVDSGLDEADEGTDEDGGLLRERVSRLLSDSAGGSSQRGWGWGAGPEQLSRPCRGRLAPSAHAP